MGVIALTWSSAASGTSLSMSVSMKPGATALAPGFIETDMLKDVPEAALDQVSAMTPMGRLGKPEEIADAIVFLASPRASYITGQVLAVNGGLYM